MKQYPAYKDSGVEWIGEIPKHWNYNRTKYTVGYEKGRNPKNLGFTETPRIYLTMEYLRGNPKQIFYVEDNSEYVNVADNEILLLWDGSNAGEFIRSRTGVLSSTMAVLKIQKCHTNYTWYYLKAFERILKDYTIGMGIPHVNGDEFKNNLFLLPPIKEQSQIATFLDHKTRQIDDLIAKKQKLIGLLQEERTALINTAVTKGLSAFDESTADSVPLKDSGIEWLGEIPEHWDIKRIKNVASINNRVLDDNTSEDFEFNYVDIGIVSFGRLKESPEVLIFKDAPSRARRILHHGDTIVSTVRTYLKAITYIDPTMDGFIGSTGFAVITPSKKFIPKYLFYLMTSQQVIEKVCSISVGVSYPATNASDIGNISVWIPPLSEQEKIVNFIEKRINHLTFIEEKSKKEIDLFTEYKTSLINEAVTGKIDVRDYQINHA